MRTEDRQAREEAGYEHIVDRAMAPLEARIVELEAENALLIDAVQVLRQELGRIADAATDMRRMPIRDLREKLHEN